MDEIEFGELPPIQYADPDNPAAGNGRWQKVAAALRERPGEWARVVADIPDPRKASHKASTLRRNGCEAARRKNGQTYDVWARWPSQNGASS